MGKTIAVLTCSLAACILLASCSRATPPPPPPRPGVLIIDAADNSSPDQSAKSYRIGNSTVPAGDFEELHRAIIAASKHMPQQDPNRPRLIIEADANVAAEAIAPVVLTAINCGFDTVDLDGNLPAPARMQVSDQPPPDPILVRVLTSSLGTISYELTGVGPAIDSEHELRELLKRKREKGSPDTPIRVKPWGQTKDEFTLTAYTQAIRAGFTRFIATGPYRLGPPPNQPPKKMLPMVPTQIHHVVYLCDRSGSLAPVFQEVQLELVRSISWLQPRQDFTILMMASDSSIELDPNGLLQANMDNKLKAARFIRDLTPSGVSTVLPSLKRAFEVLAAADKSKPGKAIYLLTDGDFAGISGGSSYTAVDGRKLGGNEAVIQWLRDHNKDKGVQVNTILLFNKDEDTAKVMKQIAAENAGQFRLVSQEE